MCCARTHVASQEFHRPEIRRSIVRPPRHRNAGPLEYRPSIVHNGVMSMTSAELTQARVLEALKAGSSRRSRVRRRGPDRDTRRDTDAAGTKIDRHHRSEHPQP